MRHIIPISGKDSLSTAILQTRKQPDLPYEYLYNPTGMDLPEVDAWLAQVERYLNITIERVGDDLESIMYEQKILPAHKARYCTRKAKIIPMEDWIGREEATVYYGIRADEKRVGYQSLSKTNITPVYPLKEAGYTLPMVWELVTSIDLLPPRFFWQSMYEMVVRRLGKQAIWIEQFKPWERQVLFAWRTRPNCRMCFYQSLWELVGYLEHHPDLYWHDAEIEKEIGGKDFFFKQNWPFEKIAEHKEAIKRKRCITICKTVANRAQISLPFEDEEEFEEDLDMLDLVSCGLFCGK
jgi:hypothetical protein